MALEQKDIDSNERIIQKNGDDIAVSIARSFEQLAERIDAAESRICSRLADVEDKMECVRESLTDKLGYVEQTVRAITRAQDETGQAA